VDRLNSEIVLSCKGLVMSEQEETPMEHSLRRASERYPEDFKLKPMTEKEYLGAILGIQKAHAGYALVHTEKDGKQAVWRCFVRGCQMFATYCRTRCIITTFLPEKSFKVSRKKARSGSP